MLLSPLLIYSYLWQCDEGQKMFQYLSAFETQVQAARKLEKLDTQKTRWKLIKLLSPKADNPAASLSSTKVDKSFFFTSLRLKKRIYTVKHKDFKKSVKTEKNTVTSP